MKISTWICALAGLLATASALIIEMNYVVLQTEPTATNAEINSISTFLSFTGALSFAVAFSDLKQKTSKTLVFILIAIGLLGIIGTFVFHNALVDVFFPKLSAISFFFIDFVAIAMAGFFLSVFGLLSRSNDR